MSAMHISHRDIAGAMSNLAGRMNQLVFVADVHATATESDIELTDYGGVTPHMWSSPHSEAASAWSNH